MSINLVDSDPTYKDLKRTEHYAVEKIQSARREMLPCEPIVHAHSSEIDTSAQMMPGRGRVSLLFVWRLRVVMRMSFGTGGMVAILSARCREVCVQFRTGCFKVQKH